MKSENSVANIRNTIEIKKTITKICFNFSLNCLKEPLEDIILKIYVGIPKESMAPPKLIKVINKAKIPYSVGDNILLDKNI
jgi:hypothetical protein|tara:strand:- start:107 stop:349 length:243 start_codon:yes stop_codon:yes gene_type:complete